MAIELVSKIRAPVRTFGIAVGSTQELERFDTTVFILKQYRVAMWIATAIHTFQIVVTKSLDYTMHGLVGPTLDFDVVLELSGNDLLVKITNNEASSMTVKITEIESL